MLSDRAFLQGLFVLKVDQFTATARHRKVISINFTGDGAYFTVELSSTGSEEQGRQLPGGLVFGVYFFVRTLHRGLSSLDPENMDTPALRAHHSDLATVPVLLSIAARSTAQLSVVI